MRRVQTMTLGPKNVVVALRVVLDGQQSLDDAATAMDSIRGAVRQRHPVIGEIFVQVESVRPAREGEEDTRRTAYEGV